MVSRTVILDLDSTLVYTRATDVLTPFHEDERNFYIRPMEEETIWKATLRRYIPEFLDELVTRGYKIIIWSAGVHTYVKGIVSVLLTRGKKFRDSDLEWLLTKEDLVDNIKDLKVIKKFIPSFDISSARLIDDSIEHSEGQGKSFILVKRFVVRGETPTEEEDDDELERLVDRIDESFKSSCV